MPATIRVNGLTLAHKGTGGFARSTLPDVCRSPTVPVPYVNVSFITTLRNGTETVRGDGYMIANKGSEQARSIGDEPGIGGGIKSGTQLDRATWLSWSPNVFFEGKPACRLTDKMLMNNGNTVCLAGHWDPKVKGKDALDLCKEACEAMMKNDGKEGRQTPDKDFHKGIRDQGYDPATNRPTPETMQNGQISNGAYVKNPETGQWELKYSNNQPEFPTNGRPAGSRIPDVTIMKDGNPSDVYEMKFGDDKLGRGQGEDYNEIAKSNGGKAKTIKVDEDCDCDGYKKDKEEAAETQKAVEKVEQGVARSLLGMAMRQLGKRAMGPISILGDIFEASPAY